MLDEPSLPVPHLAWGCVRPWVLWAQGRARGGSVTELQSAGATELPAAPWPWQAESQVDLPFLIFRILMAFWQKERYPFHLLALLHHMARIKFPGELFA